MDKKRKVSITFIYPRFCEFSLDHIGSNFYQIMLATEKGKEPDMVGMVSLYDTERWYFLDVDECDTNMVFVATDEVADKVRKEGKNFVRLESGDIIILRSSTVFRHRDYVKRSMTDFYVEALKGFRKKVITFEA